MTEEYKLAIQPISQSWTEGTGKFADNPKNTNGCSWENRSNPIGGTEIKWNPQSIGNEKASGSLNIVGNFGQDEGDELQITVGGTEFRFVASDPSAIPVDDSPIFFHSTGSSAATYLDSLVTQINAASIGVTAADGSSFLSLTASDAGINGNNISVDTGSGTTFSDVLTLEGGTDTVTSADGDGPSVLLVSQSVQSFVNQSPDVEVEVTNMVNMWLQRSG